MRKLNILYTRVSTLQQQTDRQRLNEKDFNLVLEDKCSGTIPLFERPAGGELVKYADKSMLASISVWSIDRLGRDLRDIINVIHFFTERKVCIRFISQGLQTLEADGKENPISKMVISILGIVSQMERSAIRERTLSGIALAKAAGRYTGRKGGTAEDVLAFLSKEKNKKALEYLKKGYKSNEAAKLSGLHPNTVCKIKKLISK